MTYLELNNEFINIIGNIGNGFIYQSMSNISRSREKQIVETTIANDKYLNDMPIDDLIEELNELKIKGANHIRFDSEYDSSSVLYSASLMREETEEEFKVRMDKIDWVEKQERENKETREREQFEILKKKYGA